MSSQRKPGEADGGVHLEAAADGQATINQAGRDMHVHYASDVRRVAAAREGEDAVCPYPGLAAFTAQQAQWFFGRDLLTASLLGRLNDRLTSGGPLMVVAASGAGKSSLLRAGLLPKVIQGGLTWAGSRRWPQVVFTPTVHPMREAASRLGALPGMADSLLAVADPGPECLDGLLRRAVEAAAGQAGPGARAVIVVDQFEELFTLCESSQERDTFISWLWQAASHDAPGGPLALTVCGLRADFYSQCVRHPLLGQALQQGQVLAGPMSEDELRQAISHPAMAAGLDIEPGLVEVLLRDLRAGHDSDHAAGYDAGRLPLLAHALQATWQQRHGSTLTLEGYQATGGIEHAIAETAERVFARLDEAGQRQARALFLRMVKVGASSGEDVRRPVSRSALASGSSAAAVLDAYTNCRLLTSAREAIQITHEALLIAWPRLRGWLDGDRAGNLIYQDVEDTAAGWDRSGGDSSLLYRGARLEAAAGWADGHHGELTPAARRFLAASRTLRRRTRTLQVSAVAALAVVALVASAVSVVALHLRATAGQQRDLAIDNQDLAEAGQLGTSNPSVGAQLLLSAYRMRPSQDIASHLISTENQPLAAITTTGSALDSAVFSPDGRTLAVGNGDGTIRLWNITVPTHMVPLGHSLASGSGPVRSVAFSADGRGLAVGNGDGTISLWNVADPARPRELGHPLSTDSNAVESVVFSADGRGLAVGNGDGAISLWNVADPARPRELGHPLSTDNSAVESVVLSPDSRTLAVLGSSDTISLWDITDPARPRKSYAAPATSSPVTSVAFSPDGRGLAVGNGDGTDSLWDITDPARPHELGRTAATSSSVVGSVAFSPDGRVLASGSFDGTVSLWNIINPASPALLDQPLTNGSDSPVASMAFSPDGRSLASASDDGTISLWARPSTVLATNNASVTAFGPDNRILAAGGTDGTISLWDAADPARPRELGQPFTDGSSQVGVYALAFSADGRVLASGKNDATVSLWNITHPARPVPLGHLLTTGSAVVSVAFSADGRILAVGDIKGTISLWDIADPVRPRELGQPLTGGSSAVVWMAFSPDGRTLASSTAVGSVELWSITGLAAPREVGNPLATGSPVGSVAFSADGRTLATGDVEGRIRLWDIANPGRPLPIGQPLTASSAVDSLAFSQDGRTLASSGADRTISRWDITGPGRPVPIGQPLTMSSQVTLLAFSADGRTLASGSTDGTIELWNLDVRYAINRICATTSLTRQQWHQYVPEQPYNPPCP